MVFLKKLGTYWTKLILKISKPMKNKNFDHSSESIFEPRTKQPNFFLSVLVTTLRMFFVFFIILGVTGIGAFIGIARAYVDSTPTLDVEKIEDQAQTSFIYDANGELITTYSGIENRIWASLDEIPIDLQNAYIAIEDVRFRSHQGIDIKRLLGAFINNLRNQDVQGGSTITQQLIKNRILSSERTYKRKIQEAYLAIQLEKQYTKNQILEAYLNTIYLGGSSYGVKAAAKDYFGKELNELTLRECATLAGLTANPYWYNPRTNYYSYKNNPNTQRKPQITDDRTNTVLYEMYENNFIDKEQYEQALKEKLHVVEESKTQELYDMPYFVEYVIYDVGTHLLKQRKLEDNKQNRNAIENELRTKGYKIYTTVDPEIQKTVEDSLYNWKRYPRLRNSSDGVVEDSVSNTKIIQPQAAAVVFDYHTGELKAIVGGRTPPQRKLELNRAYQANMPVGSSIKPIAVYGPAIDRGASPATIVWNIPAKIPGWNSSKGYPNNYGGGGFTGPIDLRTGLEKSLNVVAARALFELVGLENSKNYLVSLGVNPSHIGEINGSNLALGTAGITPVEMAVAFGAIGNKGVYQEPISFTKVLDSNDQLILDAKAMQVKRQVFKPSTAWLLVDMMEGAVKNGTGKSAKISGMTTAGKTGTNSDQRGVFFAGITPYYSAAVWIGHDRYKPLYSGAQGGRDAAPLWRDFMAKIHEGLKDREIIHEDPEDLGLVKATICGVSGQLATALCKNDIGGHNVVTDWFLEGTVPKEKCTWHQKLVVCTESNADGGAMKLAGPYCPAEAVQEKGAIVIPKDSFLRSLSDSIIAKYLPGAFKSFPDVENLAGMDPSNPKYSEYFCTVHTKEWAEQEQQRQNAIQNAQRVISDVKRKMNDLKDQLTQEQVNKLNAHISNVNNAIENGDAVAIQNAVSQLEQSANAIFKEAGTPGGNNPGGTNGDNNGHSDN